MVLKGHPDYVGKKSLLVHTMARIKTFSLRSEITIENLAQRNWINFTPLCCSNGRTPEHPLVPGNLAAKEKFQKPNLFLETPPSICLYNQSCSLHLRVFHSPIWTRHMDPPIGAPSGLNPGLERPSEVPYRLQVLVWITIPKLAVASSLWSLGFFIDIDCYSCNRYQSLGIDLPSYPWLVAQRR